jgi:hypothetical protein
VEKHSTCTSAVAASANPPSAARCSGVRRGAATCPSPSSPSSVTSTNAPACTSAVTVSTYLGRRMPPHRSGFASAAAGQSGPVCVCEGSDSARVRVLSDMDRRSLVSKTRGSCRRAAARKTSTYAQSEFETVRASRSQRPWPTPSP